MPDNDPSIVAKLSLQAKISAMAAPRPQSPGISPVRPELKRPHVRYTKHQIHEAVKLAAQVGVKAAAAHTGVRDSTIYKAAQHPDRGETPKSRQIMDDVFKVGLIKNPRMATLVTAARLALYWHANMECSGVAGKKRSCFDRAADRFHLNKNAFWTMYRQNQIDGITYEP